MAHKKGVGSTDNGRDSIGRRLGVKLFGGQQAIAGNIIIRQRGTKFHLGDNVSMGKDHTIHALVPGTVVFRKKRNNKTYVSIIPAEGVVTVKPRKAKKVKSATPKTDAAAGNAPQAKKAAPKKAAAPKKDAAANKAAAPQAKAPAAPKADAPKQQAPKAEAPKTAAPKKDKDDAANKTAAPKKDDATNKAAAPTTKTTTTTSSATPVIGGSTSEMPAGIKMNDLTVVEGIGPKIAEVLTAAGFNTWEKLGGAMVTDIRKALEAAEGNFASHDPGTWATQAKMAAEGKWSLLKAWQDKLDGGKSTVK